jgi:hypothetical protein
MFDSASLFYKGSFTDYGFHPTVLDVESGETTALRVSRFRTKAGLQWPDGNFTEEWANTMILHDNMDE